MTNLSAASRSETPPSGTLRSALIDTVRAHPERPAVTYRRGSPGAGLSARRPGRRAPDDWHTLTWHEFTGLVLRVLDDLPRTVGGARTVAILAETDARYPMLELACGLAGRAVQPLYATSTNEELRAAMAATGAEVLVVGASQRDRAHVAGLHPRIVELDTVVPLPGVGRTDLESLPAGVEPFDTTVVRARLAAVVPRPAEAPLLFVQSTGTTGPARVIEISERAMFASVLAVRDETSHPFPRFLSFLPTAHISERLLTLYVSLVLAGHTWYGGGLPTLEPDLRACRPTVLVAPPLVYEAVRGQALASAASTRLGRRLAESVRRCADDAVRAGRSGMARRRAGARVFGLQLRRQAGLAQVRDAFAGTAPAAAELLAWWEAVGVPVRNVYGQTELAGATSMAGRFGALISGVGVTVRGVTVALGAGDELLVSSPSAFTGYAGERDATERTLRDGWLRTGDRAMIRPDGEIVLLGRVQSLVRAADGAHVDTGVLAGHLETDLAPADVVVFPQPGGVVLYLAFHPAGRPAHTLREIRELEPLALDDARWRRVVELVESADPHRVVIALAAFDGAFSITTGEVGPTGKPRGWRIHELRAGCLRERNFGVDQQLRRSTIG